MATKKVSSKKVIAAKKPAAKAKISTTKKATSPKKSSLSIKKPFTKSQTVEYIATEINATKKEVSNMLEVLVGLMEAHLNKKGPGEMNFAGILKFKVAHKPATKSRQGTNPFTGQPMTFSAKPARNVIKIRALKKLKEVVNS